VETRTSDFDLVVLGGGTAGLVTAAGAASLGARTALLEKDRLGGECLWTGCVPSKALLASARATHVIEGAARYGLSVEDPEVDVTGVLASVREVRSRIQEHDDPERFRAMGVHVREDAAARFVSPHEVEAGGRRYRGRKLVIATGSRPAVPPVEGLREAGFVTHESAFDRDELPASSIVLGGGAIGVEFAQAYARLGVDVTLVEMEPRILPREDLELTGLLRERLEEEGVRILAGHRATSVSLEGDERRLEAKPVDRPAYSGRAASKRPASEGPVELRAEEIFVAAGRRPSVEELGLEAVGIETGPAGVVVDDRLRTSLSHVFAAGDVVGGHLFTHVADHEARTVVRNALFPFPTAVDYEVIPWCIYSDPELARVGLTEDEARERHGSGVQVHTYDVGDLDRAVADRRGFGRVKIVADRRGQVLGCHLLSPRAGTVIVEAALAMREGAGLGDLAELVHPYPTLSEGIRRTANEYMRSRLTDRVRTWLDRWFAISRRLGI
jgi:pyruvate/2-oxoglutarate dehydrogenase complex dihydrolipoamide dehydrogenase (E3) component